MKKSTKIILIAAGSTIFISIILLITLALTINAQTINPSQISSLIKNFKCSSSYEGKSETWKYEKWTMKCDWEYNSEDIEKSISKVTLMIDGAPKNLDPKAKTHTEVINLLDLAEAPEQKIYYVVVYSTQSSGVVQEEASKQMTLIRPSASNPNPAPIEGTQGTLPTTTTTGGIGDCDNLQTNIPMTGIKISTLSYIVCEIQSAIYKMIASVFDYGINVLRYYAGMRPDPDPSKGETEITEPPIFKDVQ